MSERRIPKPGEFYEYSVKIEVDLVYPYLDFTSYMFLKYALAEGAHLPVPAKLNKFRDPNQRWVRMKNIAGAYFSSPLYYEDLSKAYDTTTVHIGRTIRGVVDSIWENSSDYLKARYPRHSIKLKKPQSESLKNKKSVAMGGMRSQILDMIENGDTLSQIMLKTGKAESTIRGNFDSLGYKPKSVSGGALLKEELQIRSGDKKRKKKIFKNVNEAFLKENSELFVTMSQFFREAGLPRIKNARSIFGHFMGVRGVIVGEIKTKKGRTISYILRSDYERLFAQVTSQPKTSLISSLKT